MCCRCVPADARELPLTAQGRSFPQISFRLLSLLRCMRTSLVTLPLGASILALLFAFASLAKAQTSPGSNSSARPRVIEMRIGDEIEPIMAEYINGGISQAAQQHASLILITMDTPGGLGTSMEEMIQHILSSP